jgi:hypothetical protein
MAYRGFEPEKRYEEALDLYEEILLVWTLDSSPQDWAKTQANIGVAQVALAALEPERRVELAEKAIAAHEAALGVFKEKAFPAFHKAVTKRLAAAQDLLLPDRLPVRGGGAKLGPL